LYFFLKYFQKPFCVYKNIVTSIYSTVGIIISVCRVCLTPMGSSSTSRVSGTGLYPLPTAFTLDPLSPGCYHYIYVMAARAVKEDEQMPWRKFKQKQGQHGPIYNVATGVKVRQDACGKWLMCINKGGKRYNKTFGVGRDALKKAIEAAEIIAKELGEIIPASPGPETESKAPYFKEYSEQWLKGLGRHSVFTIERYEEILRLHILTDETFQNVRIDGINRKQIKDFLRRLLEKRSASMVEATYSVLSGIFEEAIDDEYIEINPVRGLLWQGSARQGKA
jgi:hypothetical protein